MIIRKFGKFSLICSIFLCQQGVSQKLMLSDSVLLVKIEDPVNPGFPLLKFRFSQELEYSLTGSNLLFFNHQNSGNDDQFSMVQNLKYRSLITNGKKLRFSGLWQHDLGIQYFFDSISRLHPDANSLDVKLEFKRGKYSSLFFSLRLTTRIFNAYDHETDIAGNTREVLKSSFLTPLVCLFSAGLAWKHPRIAEVSFGLSGGKVTLIRDQTIYTHLGVEVFHGVREGKRYNIEYGLALQVLIDQDFFKRIHWNCDLQLFKNYLKPVDIMLKNMITVKITKFFKGTIQTRMDYNEEVSPGIQVENLVTAGFGIQL